MKTEDGLPMAVIERRQVESDPVLKKLTKSPSVRETWGKKLDFFLSALGYAVGLGNVWRFPYLCYRHGGGAFLIPYVIMLVSCGVPVLFLEFSLGQYHAEGPNVLFGHLAPAFYGLGIGMIIVCALIALYYNMIIAWAFFYMFATFTPELQWQRCGQDWSSPRCYKKEIDIQCRIKNLTYWNGTCVEAEDICNSVQSMQPFNASHCQGEDGRPIDASDVIGYLSASEDYYLHYVLDISSGFDNYGVVRWQPALCLFLAWLVVALCLIKGISSSGKVVYFTALFPYFLLTVLFVRALITDGALAGIHYYVVPNWEKLLSAQAWGDAASQIFFSLGIGLGSWITLSSYNKFHNNCCRDAVLIAVSNSMTSIFSGFVVFSTLGGMAKSLGVPIENVVESGPGMVFVVFPEAVTKMPLPQLWAFLFFFMIIIIGLDTQFALCESVITALKDQWTELRQYTSYVVLTVCSIGFLLGLAFCTQGGIYLFTLMDWYAATWSLIILALFELTVVCWVYGIDRFVCNIKEMIGREPNRYWTICWKWITPIALLGILVFNLSNYSPAQFGNYEFSFRANVAGWLMALSSVVVVPVFGVRSIWNTFRSKQPIATVFKPTNEWGPATRHEVNTKDDELKQYKQSPVTSLSVITDGACNPTFIAES